MDRYAAAGKRASGPSSLTVSPSTTRRFAAVLIWAMQWTSPTQSYASTEQLPHDNITVASVALLPCGTSLPGARMKLYARLRLGDSNDISEKSVTSREDLLIQPQSETSTRMTLASGHAEGRRLSAAALKSGAPVAAAVVALMSSITTLLYGSPKQAYKRFSLKARRKVPWSWRRYMRSLPVIHESDFTDFPKKWPKAGNRLLVMMVKDVSPKLANFLHLGPKERLHGIVVKATVAGNKRSAQDVLNEINAHMNMVPRSKFILPTLGAYRAASGERVYLILPRLRANARVMLEKQAATLNVQSALAEMAYSVKVLHDAGFVHRDIKLLNFFVDFDGHVVLGDFEGAFDKTMWIDSERDLVIYSEGYLAPEIFKDKQWIRFNEKSDIYALGICFKHFLRRAAHVPGKAHLQRLVNQMTATDVSRRYNMRQVLNSPYFKGINFEEIELLTQGVPFPVGADAYEDTRRFQ